MKQRILNQPLAILAFFTPLATLLHAQTEVIKSDNPINNLLNDGISWLDGVVPGPTDIARFDATMAT